MKAPLRFLAATALVSAPRTVLAQDCASISSCEGCAQSESCVWVKDTSQCLSNCPIWQGLTCTFGDASVCEMDLVVNSAGDDNNNGMSNGAVVGLIIGIILLVILLLACLCYGKCRKKPLPIETKDTEETVMSNADLGSHNSHKIDVHKCHSANCVECQGGGKIDSPIKFVPADDNVVDDEEAIPSNEEPLENVKIV